MEPNLTETNTKASNFSRLLNVYWLRPETALWRAVDMDVMSHFTFNSPSLEIGCGDGVFSFLKAGGNFDAHFDVYQSVDNLELYFDNIDIYNSFSNHVNPTITQKPQYKIDFAVDLKENLIKKARTLDFYNHLISNDCNSGLPFEDNQFKTIFSNIVYWLDQPEFILREIHRVLKKGGIAGILVPDKSFQNYSYYYDLVKNKNLQSFSFLEHLDRGRMTSNIKQAKTFEQWQSLIMQAGLTIAEHKCHLSEANIRIWDIGTRPFFPVLYEMTKELTMDKRLDIKNKWMQICSQFLEPMVSLDSALSQSSQPAFHWFILKK